jgi:ribosome-associated protein
MLEQNFKLKEGQPYIPLNKLLQILGFAQTGGHAKIIIQNKEVLVNGIVETRIRKKLVKSDHIEFGTNSIKIL